MSVNIPVLQKAMTLEEGTLSSIYQWNNQHPVSKCHVSFWVFVSLKFEGQEPNLGTSKTGSHWCFQQHSSWTEFLEDIFTLFFAWGPECVSPFFLLLPPPSTWHLYSEARCLSCPSLVSISTNVMFLLFSHLSNNFREIKKILQMWRNGKSWGILKISERIDPGF